MTRNKILGDLFVDLELTGENPSQYANVTVSGLASLEGAHGGELAFVAKENLLPHVESTKAAVVVASDALWGKLQAQHLPKGLVLLQTKDAMLAMAKVSRHFSTESCPQGIHPTAVIHPEARVAPGVSIGAFTVVEAGAVIGKQTILHSHVTVGPRVQMGESCVLFPGVVLYQDTILGNHVRVHSNTVIGSDGFGYVQDMDAALVHVKIHHLGKVAIGSHVEIGSCTTIDRGTIDDTVIGDGVIIDNQVQIGHNCQVAAGAVICGGSSLAGSVSVGNFAFLGGHSAFANKVGVGDGAKVAGMSAVSSRVPAKAIWGGVPARPLKEYHKIQALAGRLPELFADWKKKRKTND